MGVSIALSPRSLATTAERFDEESSRLNAGGFLALARSETYLRNRAEF